MNGNTGSVPVSPTQTTTYTLSAEGPGGPATASVTVTVGAGGAQIIRFEANPPTITPGQQATLSWTTTGASQVNISGVGTVAANGSTTVSPTQTTTYTLTLTTADGKTVTSPVTITVNVGTVPQVLQFVASPQSIDPGGSTKLCWQVSGATSITIVPGIGSNLSPNDCATVSPSSTTTYTLTAVNSSGQIQSNVTVNVGQVRILSFTANPPTSPYPQLPGHSGLADRERDVGCDYGCGSSADEPSYQRQHDRVPDHQYGVHTDGIWPRRSNRLGDNVGVRQVDGTGNPSMRPGGFQAARPFLLQPPAYRSPGQPRRS